MEAVLEAAAEVLANGKISTVNDVQIINGLMFHSSEPMETSVQLAQNGRGVEAQLVSELRNRGGRVIDPERLHVSATIPQNATPPALTADPPGEPPLGWYPYEYPDDGLLYHGPPLRCLKKFALQHEGGWGQIVAPPLAELAGQRSESGWILPTAVLDACVVCCGTFVFMQFGGQLEVPYGFEQLSWSRLPQPGETCINRFHFRQRDGRHSLFDFTLFGEDQQPILQATGYRTIRVGGNA